MKSVARECERQMSAPTVARLGGLVSFLEQLTAAHAGSFAVSLAWARRAVDLHSLSVQLQISVLLLLFCSGTHAQSQGADLVIINANVRTLTTRDARAEAVAVDGGVISAVGTTRQIRRLIGPGTRIIDAKGKLVIPGFNDAHVHFMGIGNTFSTLDLQDVTTAAEVEARVARYLHFLPKGRWILGSGLKEEIRPSITTLGKLTPDNPMFVYGPDGKSAFANASALKAAKLTSERDENGIVRGTALSRIAAVVPANHIRSWTEIAETATNYAASLGVTSVQDMHSDDSREVYRELDRQGKLKTRVYDCVPLGDWKKLSESNFARANTAMVRGGCVKGFSDGDPTAAAGLVRDILAADKAGLQIMIHAIGNSANRIVLDGFEQAALANGFRDRRFRVEHAHNPRPADLPRFSRSNIIVSMQPHLFNRSSGGHYATLLKLNTQVAFGSDAAITDFDPLLGIYAAVTAGSDAVSVYDAVRAYTLGSALAEFQEKEKGTIEVGKLADLVILSDDIFSVRPDAIVGTRVEVTVVGGRVVYESKNAIDSPK